MTEAGPGRPKKVWLASVGDPQLTGRMAVFPLYISHLPDRPAMLTVPVTEIDELIDRLQEIKREQEALDRAAGTRQPYRSLTGKRRPPAPPSHDGD